MRRPRPRGPLSAEVLRIIGTGRVGEHDAACFGYRVAAVEDPLRDADLNLALACCYELHYRGFDDEAADLEWDPVVIGLRITLERRFETAVRDLVPAAAASLAGGPVAEALQGIVDADDGPALSRFLLHEGTVERFRDFVVQRSVYHLKEADPHTWQVPRLSGRAKEALVEIQADEYGGGRPGRSHAVLFARVMAALDLDPTYGRYWDRALPETLAAVNVMSLLGLHRRHRGASIGHLAALEMTSTAPNRRYANGLRRLGFDGAATLFFDEHVEADAVHEQIAARDMCGAFVDAEPTRRADVLWGAAACLALDAQASAALLHTWGTDG
jgi:hypothetical protein